MILEPYTMSGEKSTSGVILNCSGLLMAVDLLPPDTGTAVLKIYDHPSAASGKIVFEAKIASGTSTTSLSLPMARYINNGIYAELTDSSNTARYNVGYSGS